MDLEDFENTDGVDLVSLQNSFSTAREALKYLDTTWYTKTNRRGRWMDLIGDYAGSELFILDGDALFQHVLSDPLLALARPDDPSFQILHSMHSLEKALHNFTKRSAVYNVVFWEENRHLTLHTGKSQFIVGSRTLARTLLYKHLLTLNVKVFVFSNLSDPKWLQYKGTNKPMFVMTNDGGLIDDSDDLSVQRILAQRVFLFDLLASGIAVTLLQGAEFRDSKILTFVYECRLEGQARQLSSGLMKAKFGAHESLDYQLRQQYLDRIALKIGKTPVATRDFCLTKIAELYRVSQTAKTAPIELLFAFLAHCILLETLSVAERARDLASVHPGLIEILLSSFLPEMFIAIGSVVSSYDVAFDVDGRIYLALVAFLMRKELPSIQKVLGYTVSNRMQAIWSNLHLPSVDFGALSTGFPPPPSQKRTGTISTPLRLLPFSNETFNKELSTISVAVEDNVDEEFETAPQFDFGQGVLFADTQHWHNKKAILPKHLGGEDTKPVEEWRRRRILKSEQRFMATLQRQAGTLTGALGASLTQIVIPPVGSGSNRQKGKIRATLAERTRDTNSIVNTKGKKAKADKLSSADKLRQKIQAEKQAVQDVSSHSWWQDQIEMMSKMSSSTRLVHLDAISRNKRSHEPSLAIEILLYRINFKMQAWIDESNPESASVRDQYTVAIMRLVKEIYNHRVMTPTISKALATVLVSMGFPGYFETFNAQYLGEIIDDRPLSFQFMKLVKSKTKAPVYTFMEITEDPVVWQLRLFGEFMDRSMDGKVDHRVSFTPDAWQRDVLDCIDEEGSLLVVAPTSAGKTFISYYAMEKVLRGSDDGILVYVAPTKALVTQIAAEVYARFSKELKGGSCWAIHTRDYRVHNPQKCQILVTVPEMLAIMLLSPPLARVWTPRIKRIILDEIHSIGQQEGGAVWEQIILLAPCPIIGLSATVGSPEVFNTWLKSVQEAHGYKHKFICHPHRYSHLRKFNYVLQKGIQKPFTGLDSHRSTDRLRFLHPITMLSFGIRSLPSDLALEASDTLALYNALVSCRDRLSVELEHLQPKRFFPYPELLRQKDILRYEVALKDVLAPLIVASDSRDSSSVLSTIVRHLEDSVMQSIPPALLNSVPPRDQFRYNFIHFVSDLHVNGDLPAIMFSFDRSDCEIMAQDLLNALKSAEEKWRKSSPEWNEKLRVWENWKLRAKERERLAERAGKLKKDPNAPNGESTLETSWEQSFDPDDPSPQFSFAGSHRDTSYSKSELEEDLDHLRWASIPSWAIACLRRGIAVHHAGMNKHYRSLVESLFRQRFVRVVISTGTLALGINAPTKTSAFCGDSPFLTALMYRQCAGRAGRRGYDLLGKVVFYGLPMDRVHRLVLSKLPSLGGNFPLTSTLSLRLFNLLAGSNNAEVAVKAIQSLLKLPQISFNSEAGHHQLLHHLRFSIDYLRRSQLLDREGRPMNLFGIAAHLFYTEPSNFALVALLRNGVLHKICNQSNATNAKRDFIILMAHLFGRKYLPKSYTTDENIKLIIKKSPSIVVLPPLSRTARKVLVEHDQEILRVFTGYALTYAAQYRDKLGPDNQMPMNQNRFSGDPTTASTPIRTHFQDTAISVIARSTFVANSGHTDSFHSVEELVRTCRSGLHLNENVIPSMSRIIAAPSQISEGAFALNAYLLDFYTHGQVAALAAANGIRRGDVWYLLQDFTLSLLTIRSVLEQLLLKASREAVQTNSGADGEPEEDSGFASYDPGEMDVADGEKANDGEFERPKGVGDRDWKVYEVVDGALREFEEKYRAMWA